MPYLDKESQRKYVREWVAARRQQWMADKFCVKCGSKQNLELDHVDPELKVSHRIWSWSWQRIAVETAKCQVLCRSCHEIKSNAEKEQKNHGTATMYNVYKCKCDMCRAWKKKHNDKRKTQSKCC